MTDPQIDELLADLDRALAIEPSPSVAARVRTSLAGETNRSWFLMHWRGMAIGAAALVAVAAIVRPAFDQPTVPSTLLAASAAEQPVPAPVGGPVATPAPRISTVPPSVARRAEPRPEPEVIVSPSQRLALDQLAAAVRDGRVNSDSFPVEEEPRPLDVVRITPIVLDLVTIGRQSGIVF
jgi:hypothetical protein